MKILLAGDTHGDLDHAHILSHAARREGCERIFQLGDWGYNFRGNTGKFEAYLDLLDLYETEWWFIDGNHENFDALADLGATPDDLEPTKLHEKLTYVPRGYSWDWDGVRFLALGGAVSIDKEERIPGLSWWPEELITDAQVERACSVGKVDVLLAHDAPQIPLALQTYLREQSEKYGISYKLDELSKGSRLKVRSVVDAVQPSLVVHGHYHYRYTDSFVGGPTVNGLDRDGAGRMAYQVLSI